ncbi:MULTISPECIES: hypothetical protein [Bacillus]|uniref:hypothetical protein n=1 Tax=Bacillus TaxID=1386 RepID=UPI000D035107|nr:MULTISPECIES: hypothetical protein [Bacillus]AZV52546.1 hypothetical protein DKE43_05260 [Bacillus pumilus]MCK6162560.1 hypothetical protein [Bacillus pumilus]MCK6183066.1 hypothetical protein [Bacillus pumilus]PRS46463.1 hypothetical protein C6Y00_15760 [Bacillus sp. GBSC66]PRS47973.1 hypothetical protein C6Y06_17050 [Bacillus sp. MZGC1]
MSIIRDLEDPKVKFKLVKNVSIHRKELEKLNLSQVADLRIYAKDKYERAANFSTKASIITITIVPLFLFLNSYFNSYFNFGLNFISRKYNVNDSKLLDNSHEQQNDFDKLSINIFDTYIYFASSVLIVVFIVFLIRRVDVSKTNKLFNLIDEIYDMKLKREEQFQEDYKQLQKIRAMNWQLISCVHYSNRLEILMKSPNRKEAEFFMFYELDHIKEVEVILGIS